MKNMTDEELIAIARRAAIDSTHRYSYMPTTSEAATQWFPHRWVIDALRAVLAQEAGKCEPVSVDEVNSENAPTFMGEPNPHHPIEWYQEGIAKHWKTICDQRAQIEMLSESLKFYAGRDHYSIDDGLNWDSCSGEPSNILWHEEQPWFIEDGTVARACLDKVKELNQ